MEELTTTYEADLLKIIINLNLASLQAKFQYTEIQTTKLIKLYAISKIQNEGNSIGQPGFIKNKLQEKGELEEKSTLKS